MTNKDLLDEIVSGQILYVIAQHITTCLGFADTNEFEPMKLCAVGSRITGNFKENSDLDIALQYKGNMREDDIFCALNSEPLTFSNVKVDFIPYSEFKGNCIDVEELYISLFSKKGDETGGTNDGK